MKRRTCLLLGAALTLTGCQSWAPVPDIKHAGKFSIRLTWAEGYQYSTSGRFTWERFGEKTVLTLLSPIYSVLGRLTYSPKGARYQSGRDDFRGDDAQTLLAEASGIELPVYLLADWLKGQKLNTQQDGWRLDKAQTYPDGSLKRAQITRDGDPTIALRLFCEAPTR